MLCSGWLRTRLLLAAVGLTLVLTGCDSAEERAEGHFQNALALLESGDRDRARVEFLTVFKYNGRHREARLALAGLFRDQGDLREAYSQYLRVAEQYPEDIASHTAMAQVAISVNDWESAIPNIEKLAVIAGDAPETQALQAARAFRDAVLAEDASARRAAAARMEALIPQLPDDLILRAYAIRSQVIDSEFGRALALLDDAQQVFPEERVLYDLRRSIYQATGDTEAYETTLGQMVALYPDDQRVVAELIASYGRRGDADGAEAFLRQRFVEGEPNDAARIALVNFLYALHGTDRALAAIDGFVAEGTNTPVFRTLRARYLFADGKTTQSVAELQSMLRSVTDSPQTRETQILLAQILASTGNEVGARALVEEVLEKDPDMVAALRMKAAWLILADETDQAIILLRRALDKEPTNSQVLSTMAEAYVRTGEKALAGEMLTLAVQGSDRAPAESLLYANFLMQDAKYAAAESVLIDALRVNPTNTDLLRELARVYVALQDWPRAEQIERTLRSLDTEIATDLANRLRVAVLSAQQKQDDVISFLETLPTAGREGDVAIIRAYLAKNDPQSALAHLNGLIAASPNDPALRFMRAAIAAATGDLAGAEQAYRALIAQGFGGARIYLELVRVVNAKGDSAGAQALITEGLKKFPDSADLKWVLASQLERQRNFEGAIAVYEELYEQDTSTSVIANNLASLLSTERSDPQSLERAYRVARRLRDTDFPPYQDTYGWIAFLRGDHDEAVRYLEPAAKALASDPQTRFHLAMAYEAVGRPDDAISEFQAAVDLAGDDPRPFVTTARERLAALQAQRDNPAPKTSE